MKCEPEVNINYYHTTDSFDSNTKESIIDWMKKKIKNEKQK